MTTETMLSSALEKISCHLECGICNEKYTKPKVLDCQHSFCEECLVKYYNSRYSGAAKILCPLCQQETVLPENSIQGLKTNFHLTGLVEEVQHQEKASSLKTIKAICEICEGETEATDRCLDCKQSICPNCRRTHLRFAATAGHKVATLDDIRQGKVTETAKSNNGSQCPKHKGEVKRFYCKTCDVLICRDCTVVDHCKPEHHYTDSEAASLQCKQTMKDLFPDFHNDVNGLEQCLATATQAKEEFEEQVVETLKKVRDAGEEFRAEVTTQEDKIIAEIRRLQHHRNIMFNAQKETLSMMLKSKQHSLETAKAITDTASAGDFLSVYPTIIKDLKSLTSQNAPKIDPKLSHLLFYQNRSIGDDCLGKLEVEVSKWELRHEFGREGNGPGKFNGIRGITATQHNEFAIADWRNKRVVMCSTEGHFKGTIFFPGYPFNLTAIHNHDNLLVVVDTTKYVKVFNKDNKLAFQFPTVPQSEVDETNIDLLGLTVKKDGVIVVGDIKRNVLTEHSPINGALLRTIPVQTPPFLLAADISRDRIVVSDIAPSVDVIDNSGATLFTIKPIVNGKLVTQCRDVYCDGSGIYVAVNNDKEGTGHIHRYDGQGRFLGCIAGGLEGPRSIAFTADRQQLAVGEMYSVKMYHKV